MIHAIYMNESRHIHQCAMSYMWMSHLTYIPTNHATYMNDIHSWVLCYYVMVCICGWVMARTSIRHVMYMNESFHIHTCIMPCIWMSHFTYINASCHMYEWVINILSSHIIHYMNDLSHIHQWFMSCIWMSHVTYLNASCHLKMSHLTSINELSHIHLNESCHVHSCVMSYLCVMSYSCHIHPWVLSQIWMSHFTYINAWMSHVTRTSMRHIICMNESSHIHQCVMS